MRAVNDQRVGLENIRLINLYDYENAARDFLSQPAFDYYSSGAQDEITLQRASGKLNGQAFVGSFRGALPLRLLQAPQYSLPHLLRGLAGESDGQDLLRAVHQTQQF